MKLTVVICNFNKKEFVLDCIHSVFNSNFNDFHLIVVDNASTDGSQESIKEHFGDKLVLIENKENLGGSGGFNTGIRKALSLDTEYIMLLDNDVVIEENSISKLYEFLESNKNIAMAGSKIFIMDQPGYLQEFGADIDFENYTIKPYYKSYLDNENIPLVQYCTFIPACSLMVRSNALDKTGLMPESNFIYWDDIEWGYLFNKNGYDVAVYGESKVRHRMGSAERANTFATYYFYRNRIRFFAKYVDDNKIGEFCEHIINEIFRATYACNYNKKFNHMTTICWAFDDALNGIMGKASNGRILNADKIEERFNMFTMFKNILIISGDNVRITRNIINKLRNFIDRSSKITLSGINDDVNGLLCEQFEYDIYSGDTLDNFDCVVQICDHIFDYEDILDCRIYVDEYYNIIANDEDRKLCQNLNFNYCYWYNLHYNVSLEKIKLLRMETD